MEDKAVFGGGCFWCLEAIFTLVKGVKYVVSGYAGGSTPYPTYESLLTHDTGHAEVVQISFDPAIISYKEMLEIFFAVHDPTTPNRQGNDVGPQYRSIILYADEKQKATAIEVMRNFAAEKWDDPIVTELKPLDRFWPAEEIHQRYFMKNPEQAYCQIIINPKLEKFKKSFASRLKA